MARLRRSMSLVIAEAVERRILFSNWVVPNLTPFPDTVIIEQVSGGVYSANVNGSIFNFAGPTSITINAGGGDDIVTIISTAVPINVFADSGNDRLIVGSSLLRTLSNITANITFGGQGGTDTLVINDTLAPISRSYSVDEFGATGVGVFGRSGTAATISWSAEVEQTELYVSNVSSITDVFRTTSTNSVSVFGGTGPDTVNVSSFFQLLDRIDGPLAIVGSAGSDTVNLFDDASTSTQPEIFSSPFPGVLEILGSDHASIQIEGIESANFGGGAGGSLYGVSSLYTGLTLRIDAGNGNDTLVVDSSVGMGLAMQGAIQFNGEGGTDSVIASDQSFVASAGETYTIAGASLARSNTANPITWSNTESLQLSVTPNGPNTVNVNSLNAGTPAVINTFGGSNAVFLAPAAQDLGVVSSVVDVRGGSGTTSVTFDDRATAGGFAYTLAAGSVASPGLPTHLFSNVDEIILRAGSGNNTFNLASNNVPTVQLEGNGGADTFNFGAGLSMASLFGNILALGGPGANVTNLADGGVGSPLTYDFLWATINETHFRRTGTMLAQLSFMSAISFQAGSAADLVRVGGLADNTPLSINGGNGDDTVILGGEDRRFDLVRGDVTFTGGGGGDAFILDDSDNTSAFIETYSLTRSLLGPHVLSSTVSVRPDMTPRPMRFTDAAPGDTVQIRSNQASSNLRVLSTSIPVTLTGGAGVDQFSVGDGDIGPVGAAVSVAGGIGFDQLVVDDSLFTAAVSYTVTNDRVTTPSVAAFAAIYSQIESLYVSTGSGSNVFNVTSTSVPTSISAGGGQDLLNVALTNGLSDLAGVIAFDGQAGTANEVNFSLAAASSVQPPLTLAKDGPDVHLLDSGVAEYVRFASVSSFSFVGTSLRDQFNVQSTHPTLATTLALGDGADLVQLGLVNLRVDSIEGPTHIDLGASADPLLRQGIRLYDMNATDANGFDFTQGSVTRAGMGALTYAFDPASGADMTVQTGSGSLRTHTYSDLTPGGDDFPVLYLDSGPAADRLVVTDPGQRIYFRNTTTLDALRVEQSMMPAVPLVRLTGSSSGPWELGMDSIELHRNAQVGLGDETASGAPTIADGNNTTLRIFTSVSYITIAADDTPRLDVGNASLIFDATLAGSFSAMGFNFFLSAAHNGGTWDGPYFGGRQVQYAAANGQPGRSIGFGRAGDLLNFSSGTRPWRNTTVGPEDFLISYTIKGDTNLDRAVNFADLLKLSQNYGQAGFWDQGNFDYAGGVGFADLLALSQNYGNALLQSAGSRATRRRIFSELAIA